MLGTALLITACASEPPSPPRSPTAPLLSLSSRMIQAASVEERRALETRARKALETEPSPYNRLRMALVRAFGAALPADLREARAELESLVHAGYGLTPGQRHVAIMVLTMVDDRLRLGAQVTELQKQIDSLTEIEATLPSGASEPTREPAP
ncbi:MAG: hypothetical protein ACODAC_11875 [Pseudomonadota bacterium]